MATSQSDMDCTCPVCCDIFKDPVVLLCGHSFCKHCLQEWWRQSRTKTCPVCKEIFPMAQPPRNLALRNLSDNLRRERSQKDNSGSKEMCGVHDEKLKLFCEDDQQLICVICRDSQKHKKHNCVPISEAAASHRAKIKIRLTDLKSKLQSFKTEKLNCDKMAGRIRLQAQKTEKTITEEFEKLFQFLRAEKAARIDAVTKEAAYKSEAMNFMTVHLTAEISSLTHKIKTIEKDMKADIPFMLNVKSTLEGSQCNLPNPQTPSGVLIDEAKHVGNLLFNVWSKMKNLIQYFPITLDPNTGGSYLTISEQLTRSKSNIYPPEHENLEIVRKTSILGTEGIRFGKCSWDVEEASPHDFQPLDPGTTADKSNYLTSTNPEIWEELRLLRDMVVKQNVELKNVEGRLAETETQADAQKLDLLLTKTSLYELKRDHTAVEERLRSSEKQVEELKKVNMELRADLENQAAELLSVEGRVAVSERELQLLTGTTADLQAQNTAQQVDITSLTDRMNTTNGQVDGLIKENAKVAFYAGLKNTTGPYNTPTVLKFNKIFTNIGNTYSPTTGYFTAPMKGVYYFRFTVCGHTDKTMGVQLFHNEKSIMHNLQGRFDPHFEYLSNAVILELNDAVVPHNLVVFSISFKSFSGLPATMKGHVCGGKHSPLGQSAS
ncbi:Tripartite motif-containing protein 35 [Nibea albiflora]|uniref:Tripartite motif-containing protein 35 n=1 Tax=Nibea albiflora TaxID=240163 RepID=A0ACB7FA27_NIBAL|nr:Tripartite motif-containing protein 35 [Nibea albiflora]